MTLKDFSKKMALMLPWLLGASIQLSLIAMELVAGSTLTVLVAIFEPWVRLFSKTTKSGLWTSTLDSLSMFSKRALKLVSETLEAFNFYGLNRSKTYLTWKEKEKTLDFESKTIKADWSGVIQDKPENHKEYCDWKEKEHNRWLEKSVMPAVLSILSVMPLAFALPALSLSFPIWWIPTTVLLYGLLAPLTSTALFSLVQSEWPKSIPAVTPKSTDNRAASETQDISINNPAGSFKSRSASEELKEKKDSLLNKEEGEGRNPPNPK